MEDLKASAVQWGNRNGCACDIRVFASSEYYALWNAQALYYTEKNA